MTVHQAKGLEYAAVFIPRLNKNFFPIQRIGREGIWHIVYMKDGSNWIIETKGGE